MKYYKLLGFLDGKKVLELGCAKGYGVQWLRQQGIDAWGMDVSAYAISQADPSVQPYLITANAVTELAKYTKNAFNVIYSRGFLCCLSDADLSTIIPLMNKVGFLQIHHVDTLCNPQYYNVKTMAQMAALGFKRGTQLVENDDVANPVEV
jgi:predicted TPR repeat methyltransferase